MVSMDTSYFNCNIPSSKGGFGIKINLHSRINANMGFLHFLFGDGNYKLFSFAFFEKET